MACMQKMRIPTNSMSPTLAKGSLITVNTLFGARKAPNRWDVVVMGTPQVEGLGQSLGQAEFSAAKGRTAKAESGPPQLKRLAAVVNAAAGSFEKGSAPARPHMFFVNRVIGLPGERIQFRGSKIMVNGKPLRIPTKLARGYAALDKTEALAFGSEEYKVPANSVFVLNDNPEGSTDSRHIGAISLDFMVGRVEI
jgi:signal peptidase I